MNRPPIFLIGCMRSGTTLLSRLLSAHPQIVHLGFELLDEWTTLGDAPCKQTCEYRDKSHFSESAQIKMTAFFEEELKRSQSPRKHIRRAYYHLRFGHSRITYDWKNAIALNKSPHLMNKIGYVNSLFSNAHFIFILRDIYAHSASQKILFENHYNTHGRQRFIPDNENGCWSYKDHAPLSGSNVNPGNFELIPKMWLRLNRIALAELDKIEPQRVTKVTYESLVQNQEQVMSNIFHQLPLLPKYDQIIPTVSRTVIKDKNTTTFGDSHTKWESQLTEAEKDIINKAIEDDYIEYRNILDRAG